MSRFHKTAAVVAAAAMLSLAACSSDSDEASGGDGDGLTLGFPGGVGPTDVPAILALQALEEDGVTTDYIEFDSPDVQTQALISGDINIASMGPATVMSANVAGGDLHMIANNNKNDLMVVAAGDISQCGDLDGKPVAYHSDGSTSTAHLRAWFADECPDANPEWMVISGSANRTNALIEGQISGTIVRTEDWVGGLVGVETDAHPLAELSESQSNLLTQTIVINGDEASDLHAQFLAALNEQFAEINSDPVAYSERASEILKDMEPEALTAIYESLVEQGVFPESSALSESDVSDTIDFYIESEAIPSGEISAEDVALFDVGE